MAYQAEKPLFILAEQGMYPEDIIDPAVHPCLTFTLPSEPEILPAELQIGLHRWIAALPTDRRQQGRHHRNAALLLSNLGWLVFVWSTTGEAQD